MNAKNEMEQTLTIRQKIIELLRLRPRDAASLSRELRITHRQVEFHLNHVAKSVAAKGEKMIILSSRCKDCDFEFKDRTKTSEPSKCPKCKSEQIDPPMFEIRMANIKEDRG